MAKTIADLGGDNPKPVEVGKDLLRQGNIPIEQRIAELKRKRDAENEMLEAGGYDYGGDEQWAKAMRNVGRR